jgi:F-type H+-transporting ATPase subunit delta
MRAKKDSMLKQAREEAERIIAETMTAKEKIREELRKEEKLKMIDYTSKMLSSIFSDMVKGKLDGILIDDFINEFKDLDISHIPQGVTEVEISTKDKLSDSSKEKIQKSIKEKLKKDMPIKESIDESIVGGIVVKFGSLVLDSSIASKLKEASTDFKEEIER